MSHLEELFAEQDAISALPDEDVDAYLRRLLTQPSRRMNWTDRSFHGIPGGAEIDGAKNAARDGLSKAHDLSIFQEDVVCSSELDQSFTARPVDIARCIPERSDESPEIPGLGHAYIPGANGSAQMPPSAGNTRVLAPLPEPPSSSSSLKPEKRKSPSHSDSHPRKRRLLSPDAFASVTNAGTPEPHSPIMSFSKSEELGKPSRQGVFVDQGPQLLLVPVAESGVDRPTLSKSSKSRNMPHNKATDPDLFTEGGSLNDGSSLDIAEMRSTKTHKRAVVSEPSKLMLTLKERVARQGASKPRPKVIQLAKKDIHDAPGTAAPSDESSIIYISSESSSPSREISPAPSKKGTRATVTKPGKGVQQTKSASTAKAKKEKPKPLTPSEYAEYLNSAVSVPNAHREPAANKFLRGYSVFYVGGDKSTASETTRGRMKILVRHGANLLPRFDPDVVTHIVTETSPFLTLRDLGLKKLSDIPAHIPTVKWSWVTKGMSYAGRLPQDEIDDKLRTYLFSHAAFDIRQFAGMNLIPSTTSGKGQQGSKVVLEEEISHISDFTQEPNISASRSVVPRAVSRSSPHETPAMLPSPSIFPRGPNVGEASSSRITLNDDPLAEFYEKAKIESARDKGYLSAPPSEDEKTESPIKSESKPNTSRWTCDKQEGARTNCPNQDIIDKLSELMELHKAKPSEEDRWRAFAYSKAIRALKHHPTRVKSYKEAIAIRGIGEKTARKIAEILETGDLRRIGYEKTEDVEVARVFQGIYGVGQSTAYKWFAAGCRTLDDLRNGKHGVRLTPAQEIGLQFYDDINERMHRSEAEALYKAIEPIALSIDPKLFIRIMGSFRRGKATCGDIDILITRPVDDGKTHSGILPRLLHALRTAGILTEDLAMPDDPRDLEATYRGLCRLPNVPNAKRRRIDFLTVPWVQRGGALLYYTGDDIFNRALRYKAGAMGYSLNQRGLYAGVVRDPHDRRVKIGEGHLIASETEEEIFKILGVHWQEPHERVRG